MTDNANKKPGKALVAKAFTLCAQVVCGAAAAVGGYYAGRTLGYYGDIIGNPIANYLTSNGSAEIASYVGGVWSAIFGAVGGSMLGGNLASRIFPQP